jgi:AmmeMemoRadiSam system protein B/AmmeMemoRadiSam system protein A
MFLLPIWLHAQGIRKPVWEGKFYESRPDVLSRQLDQLLEAAGESPFPTKNLRALIAPHAGYVYSGPVAAHAYRLVQGQEYKSVIIVSVSHSHGFSGGSIYPRGGYQTPLGIAEIDEPLARELARASGFKYLPAAHAQDHTIEVQIPFIQKALPGSKIVPVMMGYPRESNIRSLARAFSEVLPGKNVLILVSSDMSHYLAHKEAKAVDGDTIDLLEALDCDELIDKIKEQDLPMCGGGGATATLLYARDQGKTSLQVLHYADSSAASGDTSRVVGYLAAAVYVEEEKEFSLSREEKQELLQIARFSIERYVRKSESLEVQPKNPGLQAPRGAFVTLKKRGRLRGCIGFVEPVAPLYQTVAMAAVYAAVKDSRFQPVAAGELDDLEIEISVLSPPRRIHNPEQVRVGKHGLIIARDNHRGLLLPQVPVENGWSRRTFLQQACLKAGLPKDAWRSGAQILVFEAMVFH